MPPTDAELLNARLARMTCRIESLEVACSQSSVIGETFARLKRGWRPSALPSSRSRLLTAPINQRGPASVEARVTDANPCRRPRSGRRSYLLRVLRLPEHGVAQESDGLHALVTALSAHPPLIIAETVLPVIDGTRSARSCGATPQRNRFRSS